MSTTKVQASKPLDAQWNDNQKKKWLCGNNRNGCTDFKNRFLLYSVLTNDVATRITIGVVAAGVQSQKKILK